MNGNPLRMLTDRLIATGDRAVTRPMRTWRTAHGRLEAFFFRSELHEGQPVEVYAVRGVPDGRGPFPAILHIHGGGQTANPAHVETLLRHGYACLSFDWTGPRDDGRDLRLVTRWGRVDLERYTVDPTRSFLVHAVAAARQALTVLLDHPRVDPARAGVFGISWGGYLTWLVNAVDERFRAAVAIYGCGRSIELCDRHLPPQPILGQARRVWQQMLDPICYADRQQAPLLFLNGTNDFFGWMSTLERMTDRLDCRHRVALEAHQNHCIAQLTPTLLAWFEAHLKQTRRFPEQPELNVALEAGRPVLSSRLLPGARQAVFYVAAKDQLGPAMFWRPILPRRRGSTVEGRLSAEHVGAGPWAGYVHQVFADGVQVSSFPRSFPRMTNAVRSRASTGRAGPLPLDPMLWFSPVGTEPFLEPAGLRRTAGALLLKVGSRAFSFNTRVVADARWRPPRGSRFYCRLAGPIDGPVQVVLSQHYATRRERVFTGLFDVKELAGGVSFRHLKDAQGRALRAGVKVCYLGLNGRLSRPGYVRLIAAGWQPDSRSATSVSHTSSTRARLA